MVFMLRFLEQIACNLVVNVKTLAVTVGCDLGFLLLTVPSDLAGLKVVVCVNINCMRIPNTPRQDRLTTIGDVDPGPEHFKTRSRMSLFYHQVNKLMIT